jgi:hypothetical protein
MPDSIESRMDRAAKRKGDSTLSPVNEEASRKWISVGYGISEISCEIHIIITYHSLQPNDSPLPTLLLAPLLYPICFPPVL